jgi:hypothetical protein
MWSPHAFLHSCILGLNVVAARILASCLTPRPVRAPRRSHPAAARQHAAHHVRRAGALRPGARPRGLRANSSCPRRMPPSPHAALAPPPLPPLSRDSAAQLLYPPPTTDRLILPARQVISWIEQCAYIAASRLRVPALLTAAMDSLVGERGRGRGGGVVRRDGGWGLGGTGMRSRLLAARGLLLRAREVPQAVPQRALPLQEGRWALGGCGVYLPRLPIPVMAPKRSASTSPEPRTSSSDVGSGSSSHVALASECCSSKSHALSCCRPPGVCAAHARG